VVTEWPPYRRPDFQRLRNLLKTPVVFDGRNVFDRERMAALGFEYWSVGRPVVSGDVPAGASADAAPRVMTPAGMQGETPAP
jgi:hypothetical protein